MLKLGTKYNIVFGGDPEAFVVAKRDEEESIQIGETTYTLAKAIPPLLLGKQLCIEPEKVDHKTNIVLFESFAGRVVDDGLAVEFHIKPGTRMDFYSRWWDLRGGFHRLIWRERAEISSSIAGFFDVDKYADQKSCLEIGCDPDQNPYEKYGLEKSGKSCAVDVSKNPVRFSGGHIHIQDPSVSGTLFAENFELLAIAFDMFLGTYNVANMSKPEELSLEKLRQTQYGKPGRIRLQDYGEGLHGIEYRTVSSNIYNDRTKLHNFLVLAEALVTLFLEDMLRPFVDRELMDINNIYSTLVEFDTEYANYFQEKVFEYLNETTDLFRVFGGGVCSLI